MKRARVAGNLPVVVAIGSGTACSGRLQEPTPAEAPAKALVSQSRAPPGAKGSVPQTSSNQT